MENKIKKIVLAYSGGLDTSVILKWLQLEYNCPVVTFTADLGQGTETESVRSKAESLGVKEIFIDILSFRKLEASPSFSVAVFFSFNSPRISRGKLFFF